MNKSEFLRIIKNSLKTYPPQISEDILQKYEDSFKYGYEKGKSDEEIISDLGDPYEIARKYDNSSSHNTSNKEPKFTGFTSSDSTAKLILVILAAIVLGPIIIGIGGAFLGIAASFIAILTTLIVTTVTTITSIATGTTSINILGIDTLSMPMSAQVLFCIGNVSSIILLCILLYACFKGIVYLCKKIPMYFKRL